MVKTELYFGPMLLLLVGCSTPSPQPENERTIRANKNLNDVNSDSLKRPYLEPDTIQIQTPSSNTQKKTTEPELQEEALPVRYVEFPGDAHFNGKPMIQQLEISKKNLDTHADTLSKLAIARYQSYDAYFPKAIADNFETGTSREYVVYPKKLIFRFQVFEDENASSPYLVQDVSVRRNAKGELFAE